MIHPNQPHRYQLPPEPPPREPCGHDLIALAMFAVAGAILGLAIAVAYVGVNLLNLLGAEWHWIWEVARV